ncbi:hypothetical protein SAMN04489727_9235 [Amycolatopsis tolypomycina]|uniref:CU044_5270 family protein n=1 Tax=Amycolatopsis tolypomycina TaxID=208445 RepID=A0A1H5D9H4_9PSEU|nr:CU044_5270 family protein [Amycolatopsis tolypomycina]SED75466.1 hypothetical protein SAMN04489727_9235 [Amycolatopsis tolypomycina]
MREDNVRKIWSEAELDAALEDLNSDVDAGGSLAFARASLLAAAGVEEAPPAGPRRSGAWRWLAVAAAVVTLVGGLGVAAALWSPGAPDSPETVQPAALADLDRPLAPGEFHYVQKLAWLPQFVFGRRAELQQKTELWIPADPKGVWHRRTAWTGTVRGLSPDLQQNLKINLTPQDEEGAGGLFPERQYLNWLTPDAAFLASLGTDRKVLAQRLVSDTLDAKEPPNGRTRTSAEALVMVQGVLETGVLPQDVRTALLDALATIPGIFNYVAPHGTPPDQRPATVYAAKDTGQRLFVDPTTARLLAADSTQDAVIRHSDGMPLSTPMTPPYPVSVQNTTKPLDPTRPDAPDATYSYAITQTAG